MLWVAGGTGVTPFVSMLSLLTFTFDDEVKWDIGFVMLTREPEVLLPLIDQVLRDRGLTPSFTLTLTCPLTLGSLLPLLRTRDHRPCRQELGRLLRGYFCGVPDAAKRAACMCGPELFERIVLRAL